MPRSDYVCATCGLDRNDCKCTEKSVCSNGLLPMHEGYPKGWARVVLMVSPGGNEFHAIGGDREPGEGDMPYIGLERIRKASAG